VYHFAVIRRFYVHNFRCLENFELPISGKTSVLLIGKNGTGKTTVALALEKLQRIARGTNRVGDLVKPADFSYGRAAVPMRFEIEVELEKKVYAYTVAFELPEGFRELRIFEEKLMVDGSRVYVRDKQNVHLSKSNSKEKEIAFSVDWHLVALPVVQLNTVGDPISIFKRWLARTLILRPMPNSILGDSASETLEPSTHLADFGAWFTGLLASMPSAYTQIEKYLKQVMPDFGAIQNPATGTDARSLIVQFAHHQRNFSVPFAELSDGEKCFMICALVLAANSSYGPLLCFWDEPDNYLAISEVSHFVMALRRGFLSGGQFIATSHNPEAIRRFSDENTFLLDRRSHIEPTVLRALSDLEVDGDLISALTRGDLEAHA